MIYFKLFFAFVQIGLFSIGGGYAAMPLIQDQIVDIHKWVSVREFTDLITISQMTPGSISINSATFVGLKIAGFPGAVVATLGNIFPSLVVVSVLGYVYYRFQKVKIVSGILEGLRPTVIALIASAGVSIFVSALIGDNGIKNAKLNYSNLILFTVSFFLLRKYKWDPTVIMILCGLFSVVLYYVPKLFT